MLMKRSLKLLAALVAISLCRQTSAATFPIANGDVAALITAITTSNANGEDDTIELATNGTYTLTAVDNSTNGPNGLPVILSDTGHKLVIHGNGATLQRSTAGGTPDFRLFQIDAGADVTIDGLTITNGNVGSDSGGGIYNLGTLTVSNSTISGNSAALYGGGIFNSSFGGSATLTVSNSTLSGNSASNGGGIYNNNGTLTITNSTLSGNSASDTGGGIFNDAFLGGSATLTITNSTLSGNSASGGGGGIENAASRGSATVRVSNSTLSGNSASGAAAASVMEAANWAARY